MRTLMIGLACLFMACTSTRPNSTQMAVSIWTSIPTDYSSHKESVSKNAEQEDTNARVHSLHDGICKLQPRISRSRALEWAELLVEESDEHSIDPRIPAAIIMRESSYRTEVRGSLGEIGLMQIMPESAALSHARRVGATCDPEEPECNIRIGIAWLARVREMCRSDDEWVWIAAYGRRSCPSSEAARNDVSTKRARWFLCEIARDCNEIWPL